MAVKARDEITLSSVIDVKAYYRYYLLQSSTLTKPAKPTDYPPPSPWTDSEPAYTEGSTNSLYVVECTVFSNNTYEYSPVSLSSSYEAAKQAYNKAQSALSKATTVETTTSAEISKLNDEVSLRAKKTEVTTEITTKINAVKIGGRNLIVRKTSTPDKYVSTDGSIADGSTYGIALTEYIPITPGTDYTLSRSAGDGDYFRIAWYDNSTPPQFIGQQEITEFGANNAMQYTWTAPSGAYNLRVSYPAAGESEAKLEEGNKATDYTPAPEDMATGDDVSLLESVISETAKSVANVSNLIVGDSGIQAQVSNIEENVQKKFDSLDNTITDISSKANEMSAVMSATDLTIQALQTTIDGGVKLVNTTSVTINDAGISIDKSNANTWTRINEDGLKVFEANSDTEVLVANSNGVDAQNLRATTFLIVGNNSRFEDYKETRTGCFWIGN